MSAVEIIQEHFWNAKLEDIKWNLRLLHNHSHAVWIDIIWNYKDIVTEILSHLSIYDQWRIYLADNQLELAKKCFISIRDTKDKNYWNAQFQIGRIEKHTNSGNNFRRSRLYWYAIPKDDIAYGNAQYSLGNLWEKYHHHYKNIQKWHRRYYDGLFKLGCIAAIEWDEKKAAAYFYRLPNTYPNSKNFQALFPIKKITLH